MEAEDKHRLQLAVLSESRLSNPRTYWREFKAAPALLDSDEDVVDVFAAYCGRFSMSAGLLLVTNRRLVFVSLGFVRRRPRVRTASYDELESGSVDSVGGDPRVRLQRHDQRPLVFQRTRPDRDQFPDLVRHLEKKLRLTRL